MQVISDSVRARWLRKQIQAHRIKRLGWSDQVFRFIMNGLGFGESLTGLAEDQLEELWAAIRDYKRNKRPQEYQYDKHGKYMYSLQRKVGWTDRALQAYLVINYRKTHWNLLTSDERRLLINQLKQIIADREAK